ncbi:Unannotated, partial [Lentimonas sp. CC10]
LVACWYWNLGISISLTVTYAMLRTRQIGEPLLYFKQLMIWD